MTKSYHILVETSVPESNTAFTLTINLKKGNMPKISLFAIRVKNSEQKKLKEHHYWLFDDPTGPRAFRQSFKTPSPPEIGSFCIIHTPDSDWGPKTVRIHNACSVNQITFFSTYKEAQAVIKAYGFDYVEYEVVEFQEK